MPDAAGQNLNACSFNKGRKIRPGPYWNGISANPSPPATGEVKLNGTRRGRIQGLVHLSSQRAKSAIGRIRYSKECLGPWVGGNGSAAVRLFRYSSPSGRVEAHFSRRQGIHGQEKIIKGMKHGQI